MENTTQNNNLNNWVDEEITKSNKGDFEKLPSMKFQENVPMEFTVDFSAPFETWKDEKNNVIKAIIPVMCGGIKMNWWLNKANPTYHALLKEYKEKQRLTFKILQTGKQKDTKYIILQ